jgi:hypothetical protein
VSDRVLQRVEAGAGRPDVVLEADRNDVATSWQPVMTLLAPPVHVVAYDRAGLGGSAPSADRVVLARQVRDLESVITSAATDPCVYRGLRACPVISRYVRVSARMTVTPRMPGSPLLRKPPCVASGASARRSVPVQQATAELGRMVSKERPRPLNGVMAGAAASQPATSIGQGPSLSVGSMLIRWTFGDT